MQPQGSQGASLPNRTPLPKSAAPSGSTSKVSPYDRELERSLGLLNHWMSTPGLGLPTQTPNPVPMSQPPASPGQGSSMSPTQPFPRLR